MSRLEKKCFVGSAAFHSLLLVVFLFGSAFFPAPKKEPALNVITLIATPTDRKISTGGSPTGNPAPPAPAPVPAQPIVQPPPAPQPEPPKPVVKPPEPAPVQEKPKEVVKIKESKPKEVAKPKPIEDKTTKEKADFAIKKPKNTEKKEKTEPTETTAKPLSSLSKPSKRTNDVARIERERHEKAEREAKERADREYREQYANYVKQQADLRAKVEGVVGGVGKELGKTTVVTPLGDGGAAFINYGSLIREIYDRAWVEPPSLVDDDGTVKAKITIARNGTIVSARVIGRSGNPVLDKSVQRVLDSVRTVPPFPSESSDAERTFTINFNLKAKRMSA